MMARGWTGPLPETVIFPIQMDWVFGWCIYACDGRLVARFWKLDQANAWMKKHRYTEPCECPANPRARELAALPWYLGGPLPGCAT